MRRHHLASSIDEALGKLSIITALDEIHRTSTSKGLLAPLAAHARTFVYTIAGALIVAFVAGSIEEVWPTFAVTLVLTAVVLAFRYRDHRRRPPDVDERRLAMSALRTARAYLTPEDYHSVSIEVHEVGFDLTITGQVSKRLVYVDLSHEGLDTAFESGDSVQTHTIGLDLSLADPTAAAQADLERVVAQSLRTNFDERPGVETGAVQLTSATRALDEPSEALEFRTATRELSPPSRLAAAASSALYYGVFLLPSAFLLVALIAGAAFELHRDRTDDAGLMLAFASVYATVIILTNLDLRPAATRSRQALPMEASTAFALEDGRLSAHLVDDPDDRVEIALSLPFQATFTRSASEPLSTTLELRQKRKRIGVSAALHPDTPADILERLPRWGTHVVCVESQDFAALVDAVAFYAEAHGTPLPWSATPAGAS